MNRLTNTREHIAFPKEAVAAGVNHIDIARRQGPSDLMMSRRQRQFLGPCGADDAFADEAVDDRSTR
jgi:hypothetical protein